MPIHKHNKINQIKWNKWIYIKCRECDYMWKAWKLDSSDWFIVCCPNCKNSESVYTVPARIAWWENDEDAKIYKKKHMLSVFLNARFKDWREMTLEDFLSIDNTLEKDNLTIDDLEELDDDIVSQYKAHKSPGKKSSNKRSPKNESTNIDSYIIIWIIIVLLFMVYILIK